MPSRNTDMVCWALAGSVARSAAIAGMLGRYMSMAIGPNAVSDPSSRVSRTPGMGRRAALIVSVDIQAYSRTVCGDKYVIQGPLDIMKRGEAGISRVLESRGE